MKAWLAGLVLAGLAPAASGCLERGDQEEPGYSVHILARGARVPEVADDEVLAMRIVNNAGAVGPLVPLHTGFAAQGEVLYWDFGTAPTSAEPVWLLQRAGEDGGVRIEHPPIVDSLPGDDAYSPFRAVFTVAVTDAYRGELITSLAALEDAIELGLVEDPVATGAFVSWPVVPADYELERFNDDPIKPQATYCQGHSARYVALSEPEPFERSISAGTAYELRPQSDLAPLDEAVRGADLNADGDQLDTNMIFELGEAPTGLWAPTELTVASGYVFGTYRSDTDLFTTDEMGETMPVPGAFIARSESEEALFRPIHTTVTP